MNPALTRAVTFSAGLLLCAAPLTVAHALDTPSDNTGKGAALQTAPRPTLTAKASVKSIKAWHQFRVHGNSTRMRAGTRVTLQQLQGKKWVSLPIHMNTARNHTYNLRVKLGIKGPNKIRVVGGGAVSNVVQVTIR
ncbi:hypothetical protein DMA15_02855 [Streptomyces sp. WAC 01529]|uniref:hypothetical protein n=1 Tax=Streptomyces sp. WAC 01529 TaxID=2203205 RepID=UPI000F6CE83F|nr:hypothetical protein [Streptomyces sp. WAC 01529]AZM51654.1 hypothetical protein DMA15_02855 [Streptomyces sp. WAC 01529]